MENKQRATHRNRLEADVDAIQGDSQWDKAFELGRVCRRAGCNSPETSSPYKHRGVVLEPESHKHFTAGWCDEDMSQIHEPVVHGVSRATSDAAWDASRIIASIFGDYTRLSEVARIVESAITNAN